MKRWTGVVALLLVSSWSAAQADVTPSNMTARTFAEVATLAEQAVVLIKAEKTVDTGAMVRPWKVNDLFGGFGEEFFAKFDQPITTRKPEPCVEDGQGFGFLYSREGRLPGQWPKPTSRHRI